MTEQNMLCIFTIISRQWEILKDALLNKFKLLKKDRQSIIFVSIEIRNSNYIKNICLW